MTNNDATLPKSRGWRELITTDAAILAGKAVIAGTRVPAELVIELLANGWSEDQISEHYEISSEQIHACLGYAHEVVQDVSLFTIASK